jgi:hypothetical protein
MRRSVRLVWIGGGIVGVAAIAFVVVVPLVRSAHSTSADGVGAAASSAVHVPPLSSAAAASLSAELSSGTESGLRQAMVVPRGQALDPAAIGQLRAIGPISLEAATFQALDATDATVNGTVGHPPAGQPATWTFTLTLVGGHWKLVDTEPRQ